jgi:site-specific DNA recombinase
MPATVRAALYLRVSTGRQADSDLSIPDQRRQAKCYCAPRGWEIVADYVEPGASATDDRRPEFQRMIDAATVKPPAFDAIMVYGFSRFFRDQFHLSSMSAGWPRTTCGWCRSPMSSATIR